MLRVAYTLKMCETCKIILFAGTMKRTGFLMRDLLKRRTRSSAYTFRIRSCSNKRHLHWGGFKFALRAVFVAKKRFASVSIFQHVSICCFFLNLPAWVLQVCVPHTEIAFFKLLARLVVNLSLFIINYIALEHILKPNFLLDIFASYLRLLVDMMAAHQNFSQTLY